MKRYLEVRSLYEDLNKLAEKEFFGGVVDVDPKWRTNYDQDIPEKAFTNDTSIDDGVDEQDPYIRSARQGHVFRGGTPEAIPGNSLPVEQPPSEEFTKKANRVKSLFDQFKKSERDYKERLAQGLVSPEEKEVHDKRRLLRHRNAKSALNRNTKRPKL